MGLDLDDAECEETPTERAGRRHDGSDGHDGPSLDSLFAAALEEPVERRQAFVVAACPDPHLRREVLSLLQADLDGGAFLETPLLHGGLAPASSALETGQRLGPYEILGLLGEGGMGRVYRARRSDGHFEQSVAVKVIRDSLDGEAVAACFRRERQILADLEHPGIARLLDGGATEDGAPFLVMELIEGEPLLDYCAGLGVEGRLELFLEICDAVQYAHRRLVVHRDLKPGNVLVDARGQPRLLDFGTAKLLDDAHAAVDHESPTARHWCSPRYASPEQMLGEPVSTATDVFGLGAVLYAMLTGRAPHVFPSSHPVAMARVVIEDEPRLASRAVLDGEGPGLDGGSRLRLAKQLRGDVDTLLKAAMAKDPERRYASVEALSDDVRRFLGQRPIRARRPTLGYRVDRFLRRHRRGVLAAALLAALALSGAAAYVGQARQTAVARDRAEAQRARAEQVAELITEMFEDFDPDQTPGQRAEIRRRLQRTQERIDSAARDPQVRAALLHTLGVAYGKLGDFAQADRALRRAVRLRLRRLGREHLETAESLRELGVVALGAGDMARSHKLRSWAAGIREKLLSPDDLRRGESRLDRANVAVLRDDLAAGVELAGRAAAFYEDRLPPGELAGDLRLAQARLDYGSYLMIAGEVGAGEALMAKALEARLLHFGAEHSEVARVRREMAIAALRRGDYAEAQRRMAAASSTFEYVLGLEHPRSVEAAQELSLLHLQLGQCNEAREMVHRALGLGERILGPRHPDVGRAALYLGVIRYHCGPRAEMRQPVERALSIYEQTVGRDHHRTASALIYLATAQRWAEDYDGAQASLERAHAIRRRFYGRNHTAEAEILSELGKLARDRGQDDPGQYKRARRKLGEALDLFVSEADTTHPDALLVELELAYLTLLEGDAASALEQVEDIRARIVRHHGEGHRHLFYARWVRARIEEQRTQPSR